MDKKRFKVVLSDCHISAGRFLDGRINPHEDFHFDDEFVDLCEYFSTGPYRVGPDGPVEVELVLNGDFFDFLNVPYQDEFVDVITEDISLAKAEMIIAGHPKIMNALRRFLSLPGKKISYLVGNHDADLFFESVRERLVREWDPDGQYPSSKVTIIADSDRLPVDAGVEIRHGNQFEAGSALDFSKPTITTYLDEPTINIPWGSYYVLKIVNRMKWERNYLDKVRPIKTLILFGLVLDPWFTLRFCFLSAYYFLKTRFDGLPWRKSFKTTADLFRSETRLFMDLEKDARELLDKNAAVHTVILGHSHRPMHKIYPDGKQYLNTGTWTKMINLDWQGLGQLFRRTFALVRIEGDKAQCDLRQWVGVHGPHQLFDG